MTTPPNSPGQEGSGDRPRIGPHVHSQRHIDKHAKRPEGSRHGSDWLSKLHRRHDAKHHSRQSEEVAPLLAQEYEHDQTAHDDVRQHLGYVGSEARFHFLRPVRSCMGAIKNAVQDGASKVSQAARAAGRAVKRAAGAVGNAIANDASKIKEAIRRNPKRVMAALLILLLASNAAIATIFGLHLHTDKKNEPCNTPSCIRAADNLLRNLSPQVADETSSIGQIAVLKSDADPCTDFDEFVCGSFSDHHDLPSDQGYLDTRSLVFTKAARLLRDTVEKPASKVSAADKPLFTKFRAHYTACMDLDTVSKKGLQPLKKVTEKIKDLMNKHEPMLPGLRTSLQVSTSAHEFDADALTDTLAFMAELGAPALVDFFVAADPMSPSEQVMFASPIQAIGLPGPNSYHDMEIVTDYRTATKETLKHFYEPKVNTTNVLHVHPGFRPKLTSILDLAQGVVDFEVKLATITPPKEDQWDMTKSYNKVNGPAFEKMLSQISLPRFSEALAPSYKPSSIIVTSPTYLSKLQSLLEITTKEVLSGFLVWKVVQRYADRIDDPALRPLRTFNANLKGSRQDQPAEHWRRCINEADNDMSWITAWFFLQDTKLDLKKANASDITNAVADALSKQVKGAKWLVAADAQGSAEKLQAVHHSIGSPKTMDASALDKYYADLVINEDAYFANKLAAARFAVHLSWSKLGKATQSEWDVTPLSTIPDYNPSSNSLTLPAALLHSPISYESTLPAYALYGSFGAISGHGLSKALGPMGSHYSKDGSFLDSWTERSRKAYDGKAQCFIDQYSKYSVKGPDGKRHSVNGNLTLSINMADAAGANAAYKAWQEYEKKHPSQVVPGLGSLTREQIFWIAFGNSLCSTMTKEKALQRVRSSSYAPDNIRIKGVVANSQAFLEAFKCPNKKPKCELW